MNCFEYGTRGRIHHALFSSYLTNVSNKLECYITLGWRGLIGTHTRAYWAHSYITKKINCFEYGPWNLFLVGPNDETDDLRPVQPFFCLSLTFRQNKLERFFATCSTLLLLPPKSPIHNTSFSL